MTPTLPLWMWGIALIIGFPLATVLLGEVIHRRHEQMAFKGERSGGKLRSIGPPSLDQRRSQSSQEPLPCPSQ